MMISIKKSAAAVTAAILILQSAASVFAGWEADTDNTIELYSTDFSEYEPGEVVGGKQLYQPTGWTIEKFNSGWDLKAYADIVTESVGSMSGVPYLRLYNNGEQKLSESVKAQKEFEIPADSEGIIRTKFRFSTNHGNYTAEVKLTDSRDKGITLSSGWDGSWTSDGGTVDGEPQTTYGSGQWRLFVNDLLGTGNSGKFAIGTANGSDDATWRNFEIAVNTSDNKISTEIAGQNITLGGGIYAVAMTCGGETNILKGILPWGTGDFCKFSLTTPGWVQGSEVRLDNVSIEYTPIVYIDNRFTNKITVKSGENDVNSPSDIGSEMSIANKLMNKSLSDKDAVVLAAVYRNGYMINSTAGFAQKVPHSVDGDESVYKQLDMTLNTPKEDIFGDVSLRVFTLDSFDKLGARCGALKIEENSEQTDFTAATDVPAIDEGTNVLTYCGVGESEANVTYAVIKKDKTLTADMTPQDFCDTLYYFGETESDSEGKYAFDIKFAGTDADYILLINDGNELKQYPIEFKNKLADGIVDEMGGITDITELKTKLDLYLEAVQFGSSLYNSNIDEIKSGETFYKIFLEDIKKNPISSGDDVLKNAKICTLMFGLSKQTDKGGFEQLLKNNIDLLDLGRVYAEELYSDAVLTDDVVKAVIFGKFADTAFNDNGTLSDIQKFLDGFGDCALLALCEKTVGAAAGKRIIQTLNTRVSSSDTAFAQAYQKYSAMSGEKRDAIASNIMGRAYDGITKLADAFKTAVNNANNSNNQGQSSGSGGGGAAVKPSGGSGSSTMYIPVDNKEPALTPPTYEIPKKETEAVYSDLSEADWAEKFVINLSERGIVSGDDNGRFYPNKPILREEFVKMLVKMLGIDTLYVGSNFADVPAEAWYYEYVSAAYANGIVAGVDDKNFGAGQNITREDMCVMLYRALAKYGVYMPKADGERFTDDDSLSGYARDGVYTLKSLGAVGGFADGTFAPKKSASRAETAKILNTVLDYLESEANSANEEVGEK